MTQQTPDTSQDPKTDESGFHFADGHIRDIVLAARAQDSDTVHAILNDLTAAETAELIAKLNADDRYELLTMYGDSLEPEVFAELDYELRPIVLSLMHPGQIAAIISALESDDALDMLIMLEPEFRDEIIRKLSAKTRAAVQEGLNFPEESAGRLMQREVVAVPQFWTVGKTIDYLREAAKDLPENFFDVFVIDPSYHVLGQIPLNRLIRARRSERIADLTLDETNPIPADMDQEEVAHMFRRNNMASAPVTDDTGRLLGVITFDDVVDVIDEEAQEDILKLGGVKTSDIYRPVTVTSYARSRWLLVNLLTAFLAAWVVSLFSVTIGKIVVLASLMPIVAGMGGNAGTQTLAVAVRAIATRELSRANTWRIILKETLVGSLNGLVFAVITGTATALWTGNPMLGLVIGAAMTVNLFAAGLFGAVIPVILSRLGSDPAVSSTVFLTTVTDIVGFLSFLGLASLLLK